MSSFQQKIKRHAKKQERVAHSHEKISKEIVTGETLDLPEKKTLNQQFKEIKKIN